MKRDSGFSRTPTAKTSRREFLGTLAAGWLVPAALGSSTCAWGASDRTAPLTQSRPTALVFNEICKRHATGNDARECPQRFDAVLSGLRRSSYFAALKTFKPRPATEEEILACHDARYVQLVRREITAGARKLSTGDTRVCAESLTVAHYAAGAACVATETVLSGQVKNAFCLTRPPGHHATPTRGMGFCIFNNVGIATRYAQREFGLGKVLIIDWDLHHGNGTQDIFYDDPSVFYFSTHQMPLYPWTGKREETGHGKGLGTTMNRPMRAGAGRKEFLAAFDDLAAAMRRFRPDLVIISCGFDARQGDPLGRLLLTDQDYSDLTARAMQIADEHASGRLVSVLEGGYSLTGLTCAAAAHVGRLQQG